MTGRLSDLNAHLFAALDRLHKPDLAGEKLADEVARAEAIVQVADAITANHRTALAAAKLFADNGDKVLPYLPRVGRIDTATQIEGTAEK